MARSDGMRLGLSSRYIGYHIGAWRHDGVEAGGAESFAFYRENARLAERGKLDFIFFADGLGLVGADVPLSSLSHSNENVQLEPLTLLSALAATTSRLGLIATASTTYEEPFHVARRFASLDHISGGRAGWNIVTSWSEMEAANFGRIHPAKDERYARAREFVEVVTGLWKSWGRDALLHDKARGVFYDPAKVHVLNYVGRHFSVRGPLPISRTPQGRPILVHAGESEGGRAIGAAFADLYYTNEYHLTAAQDFYVDIKIRTVAAGRHLDDIKILPGIQVFVGRTRAQAQDKFEALQRLVDPITGMAVLCGLIGDVSHLDPDAPIPNGFATHVRTSNGAKALALARAEKLTPRQLWTRFAGKPGIRQIIGSVEDVVSDLDTWFQARACDGFNLCPSHAPEAVADFVDLVVPALQERKLFHVDYAGSTLRENLGLRMLDEA